MNLWGKQKRLAIISVFVSCFILVEISAAGQRKWRNEPLATANETITKALTLEAIAPWVKEELRVAQRKINWNDRRLRFTQTNVVVRAGAWFRTGASQTPTDCDFSLLNATLYSDGVLNTADLSEMFVIRNDAHGIRILSLNVEAVLDGSGLQSDIRLESGDTLMLPTAEQLESAGSPTPLFHEWNTPILQEFHRNRWYWSSRRTKTVYAHKELAKLRQQLIKMDSQQKNLGTNIVFLAGEFCKPGPRFLPSDFDPTVMTTVLRSGGVTEHADLSAVTVLNGNRIQQFNAEPFLEGAHHSDLAVDNLSIILMPHISRLENGVASGQTKKTTTHALPKSHSRMRRLHAK